MKHAVGVGLLVWALSGCSGVTQGPSAPPADDAGAPGAVVTRSDTETVQQTGPNGSIASAISCDEGETMLSGGCDVGAGGKLVEDEMVGASGWTCAVTADHDGVSLRVWVECAPPR